MEVTRDEVLRCARLAGLSLSDDEIEPLRMDMEKLLSQAQKLNELDLDSVPATLHGGLAPLPRREDLPQPSLSQAESLANAPAQEKGHFRVPRML